MSSTRDQRIRRAPSKSPKKTDKSKTGTVKATSLSSREPNYFTGTNTTTTTSSTFSVNKISLGGSLIARSDLSMSTAFRGHSTDTDIGGQHLTSLRVNRLRNTKFSQVKGEGRRKLSECLESCEPAHLKLHLYNGKINSLNFT